MHTPRDNQGMPAANNPVEVLVRYARVVAEELDPARALQALMDAAVDDLGAAAAGVFSVGADGVARLSAGRGLPPAVSDVQSDTLGPELVAAVRAACAGRFEAVHALPLVSGSDLFGALVLACKASEPLACERQDLATGLADLGAVALRVSSQFQALRRTNAELLAARVALGKAEKLGALGQMAAGVAHDLANVLTPLVGDVELMKMAPPGPERLQTAVTRMSRYLGVGVDLLDRLRRFARQRPESGSSAVELAVPVQDAVELCRTRGRTREVEVSLELAPLPRVVLDPSDLTSALVNLIVNAIDAQPQGGAVSLRAGTDAASGGAWIEVVDRGTGLAPEVQARLFEPFLTTKGERGTGLGLANVYAFVHRHRGEIRCASAAGQGTTFRLEFPAAAVC